MTMNSDAAINIIRSFRSNLDHRSSIIASASIASMSPDRRGRVEAGGTGNEKVSGFELLYSGAGHFLKLHPILGLLGINGARTCLEGGSFKEGT